MANVDYHTPGPSLLFGVITTQIYIVPNNFRTLINGFSFTSCFYNSLMVAAVIILRFTHKDHPRPGVGKLFTRKARFGKTVEAAGSTLIGKQGEDLFLGDHGPRTNVISKIKGFQPVFLVLYSNFAPLKLISLKITAIHDL